MAEPGGQVPAGFLVLDKPAGISSAGILNRLKRRFRRGTKLGHAGTLDSFATGVLVVLIGEATRQFERIMRLPKGYEATLRLGATTATLDPESPEMPFAASGPAGVPSRQDIERLLSRFGGEIEQVPPAFSALKVGGRRASDLARRGTQVSLQPRRVIVHRLELQDYNWPTLRLVVECGHGFYVRSLARDIGEALQTGAYLRALRRTFVGPFTQDLAVSPEIDPLPVLGQGWVDEVA